MQESETHQMHLDAKRTHTGTEQSVLISQALKISNLLSNVRAALSELAQLLTQQVRQVHAHAVGVQGVAHVVRH